MRLVRRREVSGGPGSGRAGHGAPQLLSEGGARVQRLEEARRGGSPFSSSREPLLSRFICADQPSEWRQAKLVLLLRSPPVFSSTPRPGFYVALVSLALFPADRDLPFPSRTGLTAPPAARHATRLVLGLGLSGVSTHNRGTQEKPGIGVKPGINPGSGCE